MRFTLLTILVLGLSFACLPDFSANVSAQEPESSDSSAGQDLSVEIATLKRDLSVARLRMENLLSEQELTRLQTEIAHSDAVSDLQEYNVYAREASVQQAELDLQYSKDELADAEEELRQLGMMYDRNNLADSTAQIVMERGNRGIERQRKALELATKEHANWIQYGLPRELAEKKNAEIVATAELNLMFLAQTLALKEMENTISDLEKSIKKLESESVESGD
ncbi:MAG: hypothetical protein QM477_03385 [Planctomycetota bacterium]